MIVLQDRLARIPNDSLEIVPGLPVGPVGLVPGRDGCFIPVCQSSCSEDPFFLHPLAFFSLIFMPAMSQDELTRCLRMPWDQNLKVILSDETWQGRAGAGAALKVA